MTNHLYYGDNLEILRREIQSESVDLVYLDPPFNSNANYNVLFKAPGGENSQAQIEAFEDTWHWNEHAERAFDEVLTKGSTNVAEMLRAMRTFLGENDMMAYLTMMAVRLVELRRVLKPTGSLYLHCDPTASHYLKLILDGIFGATSFVNELIWERTNTKGHAFTRFPSSHDVIFYYAKTENHTWNTQYTDLDENYVRSHYSNVEPVTGRRYSTGDLLNPNPDRPNLTYDWNGHVRVWRWTKDRMQAAHDAGILHYTSTGMPREKRYLEDAKGTPFTTVWTDIPPLNSQAQERLGYPTQKPLALLERIISASSNPGDVVLDPFCGCGTTIHASEKLGRQWIGIDVTHLAISLIEKRLRDAFPSIHFEVHGTPKDRGGAQALFAQDAYQFQWWAVSLVNAVPFGGKKRGADGGIDGHIYFKPDGRTTEKAIVSVKGGANVNVSMIRDLGHVVDREKAKIGVFITLAKPTAPMVTEAVKAGFYESPLHGKVPKIQIITIEELFEGKRPQIPFGAALDSFRQAPQEKRTGNQGSLF